MTNRNISLTFSDTNVTKTAPKTAPTQTWVDSSLAYLYIVETNGMRVRRVALSSGIISTFVGTGITASSGDGSQASSATLNGPVGVFGDSLGDVYISEFGGHKVRVVDSVGIIETYAGTGASGSTGDGNAAVSAKLNKPAFLAGDTAGNLFIADNGNNKVRKVTYATGDISTFAGTGIGFTSEDHSDATSGTLLFPVGLFVTSSNDSSSGTSRSRTTFWCGTSQRPER